MNFDQLTEKIQNILDLSERTVIVAISGFGGSGKTTLTNELVKYFPGSEPLNLDNFIVNHAQGEGLMGGYDWERFESVLQGVKAGKDLHYQFYDWELDKNTGWIDSPLPKLLVVEGIRLLQPDLMHYFDLSIWIDKSSEEATIQGKARDRQNKNPEDFDIEAHIALWDSEWAPKDQEYARLYNPKDIAQVLYRY